MGLRCFVINDCIYVFDIEATGCEIGGQEEIDAAISEAFNGRDTLLQCQFWRRANIKETNLPVLGSCFRGALLL